MVAYRGRGAQEVVRCHDMVSTVVALGLETRKKEWGRRAGL
jgi:hypothetical protein